MHPCSEDLERVDAGNERYEVLNTQAEGFHDV